MGLSENIVQKILGKGGKLGNIEQKVGKYEGKEFLDKPVHEATESLEEEHTEHRKHHHHKRK